jgi:hypothetical protein
VLAVYGVLHRLYPGLGAHRLAALQFWAASLGALLLVLGIFVSVRYGSIAVVSVASIIVLASAGLFVLMFARASKIV